jgi:hypothetical protein
MYRQLNWVNQNSVDICGSPAIYCDGYRLRGCAAVYTDRHLLLLATKNYTSCNVIEE